MQKQSYIVYVWIGIEMINARRVERAGASNDPVDFVAFLKQQIRQITSVLARNAGDQCLFHAQRLALKQNVCTIKSLWGASVKRHRKNIEEGV
jgi:hypothetical protein